MESGESFTITIDDDGTVWRIGYLQIGGISFFNSPYPGKLDGLVNISSIGCGVKHISFLDNNGDVWTMGDNGSGQLGTGDFMDSMYPQKINSISNITSISCNGNITMCIDNEFHILSCGANKYGQLGLGDTSDRNIFTVIPELENITKVACGLYHSCFLDIDGRVFITGKIESMCFRDITPKAQVKLNEPNITTPLVHPLLPPARNIACGLRHTIIEPNEPVGNIILFGMIQYRNHAQRFSGAPRRIEVPEASFPLNILYCGYESVIIVDSEGQSWAMGLNNLGSLGIGHNQPALIDVLEKVQIESGCVDFVTEISQHYAMYKTKDNQVYFTGDYAEYLKKQGKLEGNNPWIPRLSPSFPDIIGSPQNYSNIKSARK